METGKNFNFAYDVVDRYALECPQKTALIWCNDNGEEKIFTFEQMSAWSKKTAAFLAAHNIKKGDVVMLMLRRRYEYWFFILALHRIGAIAIPTPEQLHQKDIEYRIKTAGVKMIVASDSPELLKKIDACHKNSELQTLVTVGAPYKDFLCFHEEIKNYKADFPRPTGSFATKATDPMLVFFTSGTSGQPKMVMHNFLYPLGHVFTAQKWHKVVDGGVHFSVAETGWAKTSWGKIYGQWMSKSAVFVYDRKAFSPQKILQKIQQYKITTFCATPTIYKYLLRCNFADFNLSSLKHCTCAGEPLSLDIFNSFYEKTGLKIYEGYGQTETSVLIANYNDEPKPGSLGKASTEYNLEVLSEDGAVCKNGQTGELVVNVSEGRPNGLLCGYYKAPDLTAAAFKNGFYHTGDLVHKDAEGFFWFEGRKDDVIKSAGFRISPYEVESVLMEHDAVKECAVIGVADESRGQIVKAFIVLNKGFNAEKSLQNDIISFVKKSAALYKCPRIVEFVSDLPKTPSGKICRGALRKND